jgi:hypothetical protein
MGFKINVYLAEATMGRGLGSSEKVWYRWTNMGGNTHVHGNTLGISLYNCLYHKLANMLYFSYYLLWFLFNKIREQEVEQVLSGSRGKGRRWPK